MQLHFSKKGAAFVLTIIMVVVALAAIASLYQTMESRSRDITVLIATEAQAKSIADAAHIDALNWFRVISSERQSRFFPIRDLSSSSNIIDETDDPVIGLVREHVLSESPLLIARYEVRRQYYHPDFPEDPNMQDLDVPGHQESSYLKIDPVNGVEEIKSLRNAKKNIFKIISYGFIFRPKNPETYTPKDFYLTDSNVRFQDTNGENRERPLVNQYNLEKIQLFGRSRMYSEILELEVSLPFPAAVNYRGGLNVTGRGVVQTLEQNSVTTARHPQASAPTTSGGGTLSPSGSTKNIIVQGTNGVYDDSIAEVFGLPDEATLMANPDTIVFESVDEFEARASKINFLGSPTSNTLPTFVIDANKRIFASNAIIYVRGNLEIRGNSNFFCTGILYVVGRLTMLDTTFVTGGIIIQNRNTTNPNLFNQTSLVSGSFDASTATYQENVIDNLQKSLGQYTFFTPPHLLKDE